MNLSTQFSYIFENLLLYRPDLIMSIVAIIVGFILLVALYFILLYSSGFALVIHEANMIKKKKSTLGDLILMKDIQTEMEHEIEQATLKATFQS
jgi:hypothetical protein